MIRNFSRFKAFALAALLLTSPLGYAATLGSTIQKPVDGTALIQRGTGAQSSICQLSGVPLQLARAEFDFCVAGERSNITSNAVGIYTTGDRFRIVSEVGERVWTVGGSASASNANTVVLVGGKTITLGADTNTVTSTSGLPTGGNSGDVAVDVAGNAYYTNASGTWSLTGTLYPAGTATVSSFNSGTNANTGTILRGDGTWSNQIAEGNVFAKVYRASGGGPTFTDNTTEAATSFGTPFNSYFTAGTDYIYVGKATQFKDISVSLAVTGTTANTLLTEYWNGTAWTTLTTTDGTNGMNNNGSIVYTIPGSWAQTAVNAQTLYWMRTSLTSAISTAVTIYSIRPGSNPTLSTLAASLDTLPALSTSYDSKVLANGVPLSAPAVITVGTSTSRYGKSADIMCSGAKDQQCLIKAIALCPAGACKILMMEGIYNLNAGVTPLRSNLEIAGMGMGNTHLVMTNTTAAMFQDTTSFTAGAPGQNISFHDFECDRSADTKDGTISRKCFYIQYLNNFQVYNTYVHDAGGTCIGTDFLNGAVIHHNIVSNCGTSTAGTGSSGIGIGIGGVGGSGTEPNVISDNIITGSGLAAVLLENQGQTTQTNNFVVANNVMTGSPQYGIFSRGASNAVYTGNVIRSNTKSGILLSDYTGASSNNVLIGANVINSNTLYGVQIVSTAGTNISVKNNDLTGNGSGTITSTLTDATQLEQFGNRGGTYNDVIAPIVLRGTAPTIASACGTTPTIVGVDGAATVTIGTGGTATTCVVTLSLAGTNPMVCTANSDTDAGILVSATTSAVTVSRGTAFTAGSKLSMHCNRWNR